MSLHADSTSRGPDAGKRGFHIIVPKLPIPDKTVNRVQSGAGRTASVAMRDAFVSAGLRPANYAGVRDGLQGRSDIAAVNLTTVPAVFIEMGNLSNPADAMALTSKEGSSNTRWPSPTASPAMSPRPRRRPRHPGEHG